MEIRPKECKFPIKKGSMVDSCGNYARKGTDFCWMHDGTPKKSERLQAENEKLKEINKRLNFCLTNIEEFTREAGDANFHAIANQIRIIIRECTILKP